MKRNSTRLTALLAVILLAVSGCSNSDDKVPEKTIDAPVPKDFGLKLDQVKQLPGIPPRSTRKLEAPKPTPSKVSEKITDDTLTIPRLKVNQPLVTKAGRKNFHVNLPAGKLGVSNDSASIGERRGATVVSTSMKEADFPKMPTPSLYDVKEGDLFRLTNDSKKGQNFVVASGVHVDFKKLNDGLVFNPGGQRRAIILLPSGKPENGEYTHGFLITALAVS